MAFEPTKPLYLPDELLFNVLSAIPEEPASQPILHSFTLVCRQWYHVAIARLYYAPAISSRNFNLFVRTICPSINVGVRKTDLSALVHELDMRYLVHNSTKSLTARLLGRTKLNLEVFVAPQSSFGVNSFAALAKCSHLRRLDLTLVHEAIPYDTLSAALRNLSNLEVLHFPRSSAVRDGSFEAEHMMWPSGLRELHLAGGLTARFVEGLADAARNFPPSLTSLSITNSPILDSWPVYRLLNQLGPQIKQLSMCMLPRFRSGSLNDILAMCPRLEKLSISTDYVSEEMMCADGLDDDNPLPLRELRVSATSDPSAYGDRLEPMDVQFAIERGLLANLRRVVVTHTSGWLSDRFGLREDLDELEMVLLQLRKKDFDEKRGPYEGRPDRRIFEPPANVVTVDRSDSAAYGPGFDW